jgi:hypothetical protein
MLIASKDITYVAVSLNDRIIMPVEKPVFNKELN